MKVLTLTQPWATLVAIGAKKIETRSWATSYRGPLAIHAAKGLGPVHGAKGLQRLCDRVEFANALYSAGIYKGLPPDDGWFNVLPLGAIVAVCYVVNCITTAAFLESGGVEIRGPHNRLLYEWEPTDQERAFGDYGIGRFAWLLSDIHALPEPIPAKGARGLWETDLL